MRLFGSIFNHFLFLFCFRFFFAIYLFEFFIFLYFEFEFFMNSYKEHKARVYSFLVLLDEDDKTINLPYCGIRNLYVKFFGYFLFFLFFGCVCVCLLENTMNVKCKCAEYGFLIIVYMTYMLIWFCFSVFLCDFIFHSIQ